MSVEIEVDAKGMEELREKMQRVDSAMQRNVHRQLASLGADIKAMARQIVPVRTGRLRASIYARVEEWMLKIGAEAPYAYFVEAGTTFFRGFFFLTRSIQMHLPQLKAIISQAINESVQEAGS